MMRLCFANALLAFLLTMPGCGKTEMSDRPAELAGVTIGGPAPEIEGTDLEGKKLSLSDYRGKVIAVSFWASWCGPCRQLFPHEKALVDRYRDRPFVLLGVDCDAKREDGLAMAIQKQHNWRSFWDKSTSPPIASRFGIRVYPTTYLIDAQGLVREKIEAFRPDAVAEGVERLVAEAESSRRK
jgi:thiol-disulfide isomerase/thioredoxin